MYIVYVISIIVVFIKYKIDIDGSDDVIEIFKKKHVKNHT